MTNGETSRLDRLEALAERILLSIEGQQVEIVGLKESIQSQQAEMDANFEFIGTELGGLQRQITEGFRQSQQQIDRLTVTVERVSNDVARISNDVEGIAQQAEQDRSQAAIDRAEFRSTVEQLLAVLTQRFNGNGHEV
jgi:outer membrane murein-binding lipoprotein Lpp